MTTKVSYCKNTTYIVLCFVKSLPWLFNRNLLTDIKISFYRNIVCRNVSFELGLNIIFLNGIAFDKTIRLVPDLVSSFPDSNPPKGHCCKQYRRHCRLPPSTRRHEWRRRWRASRIDRGFLRLPEEKSHQWPNGIGLQREKLHLQL